MPRLPDAAEQILNAAEPLMQLRGFNGFAYKDIAAELGIRNASIHFHYPSKVDLGVALVRRYTDRFLAALAGIDARWPSAPERLAAIRDLFAATLANGSRICLCGVVGAELLSLPAPMVAEARRFFDGTRAWLAGVLAAGRSAGQLAFDGEPEIHAGVLLAVLEGAMLVGRMSSAAAFVPTIDAALRPLLARSS
jgi:TetR/AcrR family transcriptional repressor of nem operon